MKKYVPVLCLTLLTTMAFSQEKKINVIVFGAHPDDCDNDAGGQKWATMLSSCH